MKTKRGILGLFLALCVVWSMLPLGAFAADENAGDEPKPISAIADLLRIDQNLSGNYVLTNDIDLSNIRNLTPIGTEKEPFTGTFDGNGHKITGLTINKTDSEAQGLFGYVGSGGTVKNLTVSGNVSVSGTGDYVGSVVGFNKGGTVENCCNTGEVSVSGTGIRIGGVVGQNNGGTVENCCNTGVVSGSVEIVGGVVGFNESGTVKNCYNTGEVSDDVGFTGGVVGYNVAGTVENCYNTGEVSDGGSAGGVVGYSGGTVKNCYNTGEVSGDVSAGGVVGYSGGTVTNCYNTGAVNGDGSAGGVVGSSGDTVTNCYYLEDTADGGIGDGSYTGNGVKSLSTEEFSNKGNFTDWDFNSTWEMSALLGRPILQSNREGGSGTPESPYEIPDLATLERARDLINDDNGNYGNKSYVLTDDIDMSGKYGEGKDSWTPIGTSLAPFTGTFDGQGHRITGLYINASDSSYQGLFGYMSGTNSAVRNLTVSGTVSGNSYVGGVVGWNSGSGTVTNCYNTGEVTGTGASAGGVVGENSGTVENCSNTGEVSGEGSVGGVVGENNGTVENCSNTGKVSGTDTSAGGVVGENNGIVENCSNTGEVSGEGSVGGVVGENSVISTVTNCYNTGTVSGSGGNSAGGVVGNNFGGVTNCYNTGSVSGSSLIGGVVGWNDDGTVANCYYEQGKAASGIGSSESNENAESKDVGAFKSGEVAWLLQNGQTPDGDTNVKPLVWGQKIDEDDDPVLTAFNPDAPQVYRVTFAGAEDVPNVPDQYVNANCTVTEPDIRDKEDSTLGWYSDSRYTTRWDFENDTVRQDMTLHAKWLSNDASVSSVTVKGTAAARNDNNTFTVTLPSLPTANDIQITAATGATVTSGPTMENDGATWTFTVTAEDGTTADYTIQITVEQPAPDPEPETPVTPPAPPSGGGPSNPTYRPDIGTTENGEVDVSTTRPHAGDTVTVTPKPDDGYDVQTVTVTDEDGETVPVTPNADGSFTFTQPEGEVTIDVAFTPHVSSSIQLQDGSAVEIASPDDVIEIPQSSTFTVHFTSEKPLSDFAFLAGNGKAIATDTVSVWNPETREGTYTLYGLGAPGSEHDTTGIYVNGVKLFTMKVVPRPLTSDTTVDFAMQVGGTYQFWVKPDDPDASYTFNTANGDMLQTSIVKDAYPDAQGRYLCRLTVTGRGDTVGVYCQIDGNTYKLFTVNCQ